MRTRVVEKPAFTVAGIAVDTNMADQAKDAAPLAARFFAPGFGDCVSGRIDPRSTIAAYVNWSERDATYRLIFGYEVAADAPQPAEIEVLTIPAARYTVFTAVGPQPQASIDAWAAITAWRANPTLKRTGAVSFETHDARARAPTPEVDIYIPAV